MNNVTSKSNAETDRSHKIHGDPMSSVNNVKGKHKIAIKLKSKFLSESPGQYDSNDSKEGKSSDSASITHDQHRLSTSKLSDHMESSSLQKDNGSKLINGTCSTNSEAGSLSSVPHIHLPVDWRQFRNEGFCIDDIRQIRQRLLSCSASQSSVSMDRVRRPEYRDRQLKHFAAAGVTAESVVFPQEAVRHTTAEPSLSFCANPATVSRVKSRDEVLLAADDDGRKLLSAWLTEGVGPGQAPDSSPITSRLWYGLDSSDIGDRNKCITNEPTLSLQKTVSDTKLSRGKDGKDYTKTKQLAKTRRESVMKDTKLKKPKKSKQAKKKRRNKENVEKSSGKKSKEGKVKVKKARSKAEKESESSESSSEDSSEERGRSKRKVKTKSKKSISKKRTKKADAESDSDRSIVKKKKLKKMKKNVNLKTKKKASKKKDKSNKPKKKKRASRSSSSSSGGSAWDEEYMGKKPDTKVAEKLKLPTAKRDSATIVYDGKNVDDTDIVKPAKRKVRSKNAEYPTESEPAHTVNSESNKKRADGKRDPVEALTVRRNAALLVKEDAEKFSDKVNSAGVGSAKKTPMGTLDEFGDVECVSLDDSAEVILVSPGVSKKTLDTDSQDPESTRKNVLSSSNASRSVNESARKPCSSQRVVAPSKLTNLNLIEMPPESPCVVPHVLPSRPILYSIPPPVARSKVLESLPLPSLPTEVHMRAISVSSDSSSCVEAQDLQDASSMYNPCSPSSSYDPGSPTSPCVSPPPPVQTGGSSEEFKTSLILPEPVIRSSLPLLSKKSLSPLKPVTMALKGSKLRLRPALSAFESAEESDTRDLSETNLPKSVDVDGQCVSEQSKEHLDEVPIRQTDLKTDGQASKVDGAKRRRSPLSEQTRSRITRHSSVSDKPSERDEIGRLAEQKSRESRNSLKSPALEKRKSPSKSRDSPVSTASGSSVSAKSGDPAKSLSLSVSEKASSAVKTVQSPLTGALKDSVQPRSTVPQSMIVMNPVKLPNEQPVRKRRRFTEQPFGKPLLESEHSTSCVIPAAVPSGSLSTNQPLVEVQFKSIVNAVASESGIIKAGDDNRTATSLHYKQTPWEQKAVTQQCTSNDMKPTVAVISEGEARQNDTGLRVSNVKEEMSKKHVDYGKQVNNHMRRERTSLSSKYANSGESRGPFVINWQDDSTLRSSSRSPSNRPSPDKPNMELSGNLQRTSSPLAHSKEDDDIYKSGVSLYQADITRLRDSEQKLEGSVRERPSAVAEAVPSHQMDAPPTAMSDMDSQKTIRSRLLSLASMPDAVVGVLSGLQEYGRDGSDRSISKEPQQPDMSSKLVSHERRRSRSSDRISSENAHQQKSGSMVSESPSGKRSKSPQDSCSTRSSERRSKSPVGKRSRSPDNRSARSSKRRSISPRIRSSKSPTEKRPPSPGRRRSKTPDNKKSSSPGRRRSKSPRKRSRSPDDKRTSSSSSRRRSRSPRKRRSRSPSRRSRSPGRRRSRSPRKRRSRSPRGRRPRSPARRRSRSPKTRSRSPTRRRSRSPIRRRSRSPRRRSRSPNRRRSRSPRRRRSPSPGSRHPGRSPLSSDRKRSASPRSRRRSSMSNERHSDAIRRDTELSSPGSRLFNDSRRSRSPRRRSDGDRKRSHSPARSRLTQGRDDDKQAGPDWQRLPSSYPSCPPPTQIPLPGASTSAAPAKGEPAATAGTTETTLSSVADSTISDSELHEDLWNTALGHSPAKKKKRSLDERLSEEHGIRTNVPPPLPPLSAAQSTAPIMSQPPPSMVLYPPPYGVLQPVYPVTARPQLLRVGNMVQVLPMPYQPPQQPPLTSAPPSVVGGFTEPLLPHPPRQLVAPPSPALLQLPPPTAAAAGVFCGPPQEPSRLFGPSLLQTQPVKTLLPPPPPPPPPAPAAVPMPCPQPVVPLKLGDTQVALAKTTFYFPSFQPLKSTFTEKSKKKNRKERSKRKAGTAPTDLKRQKRRSIRISMGVGDSEQSVDAAEAALIQEAIFEVPDVQETAYFDSDAADPDEGSDVDAAASPAPPKPLPAPARSILVIDGFGRGRVGKRVVFLDGYRPGDASPSDEEDSPPSPAASPTAVVSLPSARKRSRSGKPGLKLKVRVIRHVSVDDWADDAAPCPPPPPPTGSPPPQPYYYLGPAGLLLSYMQPVSACPSSSIEGCTVAATPAVTVT